MISATLYPMLTSVTEMDHWFNPNYFVEVKMYCILMCLSCLVGQNDSSMKKIPDFTLTKEALEVKSLAVSNGSSITLRSTIVKVRFAKDHCERKLHGSV